MLILQGISANGGICIGKLMFLFGEKRQVVRREVDNTEAELKRYKRARKVAEEQLQQLYEQNVAALGEKDAEVFLVQKLLINDSEFVEAICRGIDEQHVNAEYGVRCAGEKIALELEALPDAYLRERSADMRDVTERLITILTDEVNQTGAGCSCLSGKASFDECGKDLSVRGMNMRDEDFIVAAEDLLPSQTVQLSGKQVLGFALGKGSLQSHATIFARGLGVPLAVQLGEELNKSFHGADAILDGEEGRLYIAPNEETLHKFREKLENQRKNAEELIELVGKENITKDGRCIRVYANVGNLEDVDRALECDAGGIGLLRSECLYMGRDVEPDEEEQFEFYKEVLERMGNREVIVRTFDIGGDKQVSYLGTEAEENPALGLRAIRLGLTKPKLLKTQLRALYRAGIYGNLKIMYPMIASVEEVRALRALEQEALSELRARFAESIQHSQGTVKTGKVQKCKNNTQPEIKSVDVLKFAENIPVGIMIETPAAALLSDELAREVDFFCVGTNDLSQYTLALDRQNANLTSFWDLEHRAVRRLVKLAAENAHKAGISIGICGELAADIRFTEEFLEMGIDELSVSPTAILPLRKRIRAIDSVKEM